MLRISSVFRLDNPTSIPLLIQFYAFSLHYFLFHAAHIFSYLDNMYIDVFKIKKRPIVYIARQRNYSYE